MLRRSVRCLQDFIPQVPPNFTDVYQRHREEHPNTHVPPWEVKLGTAGVAVTEKMSKQILNDPLINKDSAFTPSERDRLQVRGLIPPRLVTMKQQLAHLNDRFSLLSTDMEKYEFCQRVHDRNEVLFYRWVMNNIDQLGPIIYTPTVGDACLRFAENYTRPRGMYFSSNDKGEMLSMIYNWPHEVDVIVVTDGGRVLGLGDLGANGMGIPIGKLSLYVAIGGIHPGRVLPVMLDVGTNNTELRNSPYYLGMNHRRLTGEVYFELVDEFMRAVKRRWPQCLVQFEDFSSNVAAEVLSAYRKKLCCFNDDIQGTGSVVLAALFNSLRLQKLPLKALSKQRIVIVGAGSAGLGVTQQLAEGMHREGATTEEVNRNFFLFDDKGLITKDRQDVLHRSLQRFAKEPDTFPTKLLDLVKEVKPEVLCGLTGCPGIFTEEVVREMARNHERPIIFPLSNPTSRAEVTAKNAYTWTEGRCIFASGSPFQPVEWAPGKIGYPSQSNNMYIFPGVGLGAVLTRASRVTDEMFYAAAKALALRVSDEELQATGKLFPDISAAREISACVAAAVIKEAHEAGLARDLRPPRDPTPQWVQGMMFIPEYGTVVKRAPERSYFARDSAWKHS